mmetsp:Transcript_5050/g.5561  ORF Transcript_5050/g.5561 Transcript_5050/m.5561 type:complete len:318 (-) Transcript_5050:136-1089(-)
MKIRKAKDITSRCSAKVLRPCKGFILLGLRIIFPLALIIWIQLVNFNFIKNNFTASTQYITASSSNVVAENNAIIYEPNNRIENNAVHHNDDKYIDKSSNNGIRREGKFANEDLTFLVPKIRNDLGYTLEKLGYDIGAEIGVKRGRFGARHVLPKWKNCKKYILIDPWAEQENYIDGSNSNHEGNYKAARIAFRTFEKRGGITQWMRMLSTDAAKKIDDESLDFVYVDARHDYCGAWDDMNAYWPKVRSGGMMAGHDYQTAEQALEYDPVGNWSICADGSVNPTAVLGAVNDFTRKHNLKMYTTNEKGPSWMFRKPL